MCWFFDGLVLAATSKAGPRGTIFPSKGHDLAFCPCSDPNHTLEKAPARHDLPLDFQWKLCAWAAETVKNVDPETAAKFAYIEKHRLSMGHDQSIFDKYLLRIRIGSQPEQRSEKDREPCKALDYAEVYVDHEEI